MKNDEKFVLTAYLTNRQDFPTPLLPMRTILYN